MFFSFPFILNFHSIITQITDNIKSAVVCFDKDNNCIYINRAAKNIFGNEPEKSPTLYHLSHTNENEFNTVMDFEIESTLHTFTINFKRLTDKKGRVTGSYIKLDDITDDLEKTTALEYKNTHDELTKLYSKEIFFQKAQDLLRQYCNNDWLFICTNIKNLKLINERFSIDIGNKILKTEAEMLKKANYKNCIHGRISGDKFAMLIPKENFNQELALKNTSNITISTSHNPNYKIQVYIGVYEVSDTFESVESMYDKANIALKNITEDNFVSIKFYDSTMMNVLRHEKKIIALFDTALKEHQFKMYLQPQVESSNLSVVGAEALVRWKTPDNCIIQPEEFLPVLEKTGYFHRLDEYIWECAVVKLKEWSNSYIDKYISVNVSTNDFYYIDVYQKFTDLVQKYGISPSKLKLEITETVFMHNIEQHAAILKKLQQYGFTIEMDDFGSGYSSLNMLKDINVDILKIDMNFLYKSDNEERRRIILNSIIKMADELGLQTIAEGVEEKEQVDNLKNMGCDILQGFYFAKPLSVRDFEQKYNQENIYDLL